MEAEPPKIMNKKYLYIGLIFLLAGLFLLVATDRKRKSIDFTCVEISSNKVSGDSLSPVIINGTKVVLLKGYYGCNEFKRGDLVVFKLKIRDDLFIKELAGLPYDKVEFENSNIKINDKILSNSEKEIYQFDERMERILEIPLKDGGIPLKRFLVLGEPAFASDSFDSRTFGYIDEEYIIGRVLTLKEFEKRF